MTNADFAAAVEAQAARLLGCDWGRRIATADYRQPCKTEAVQRICLHGPDGQKIVQLCGPHRDFVLLETNPHGGA